EARPRLATCLDGAVELTPPEIVAADHRAHLAGVGVDGDERALHLRLLVECEAGRLVWALSVDADGHHVAGLEGAGRAARAAPRQRVGGERAALPRRAHRQSLGADVEDDGSGAAVLGGFVPLLPREEAFHLLPLTRVEVADGAAETLTVIELAE